MKHQTERFIECVGHCAKEIMLNKTILHSRSQEYKERDRKNKKKKKGLLLHYVCDNRGDKGGIFGMTVTNHRELVKTP